MANDIIFCNSFAFHTFCSMNYKHTDNSAGAPKNFFAYMSEGWVKLCMKDKTVIANQGDIFFIPEGCSYHSYWYGEPRIEYVSLGFHFMPNFENKQYGVQVIPPDGESVQMFRDIVGHGKLDCRIIGDFYTLVARLMPQMTAEEKGRQADLVEQTKHWIVSEPDVSIRELAKRSAVSESTLYAVFKRYSDVSIHEWRRDVILEKAKELLISTDHSVAEIARMLRFSSDIYFRKCFKEKFGASPRGVRKGFGI